MKPEKTLFPLALFFGAVWLTSIMVQESLGYDPIWTGIFRLIAILIIFMFLYSQMRSKPRTPLTREVAAIIGLTITTLIASVLFWEWKSIFTSVYILAIVLAFMLYPGFCKRRGK